MKPLPECRGCLENLARQTVTLATPDNTLQQEAILAACNIIDDLIEQDIVPANIASVFHRKIKKITGNSDPFSEFKRQEINHVRNIFGNIKDELTADLESLIKFSIKGNALDFFRSKEEIIRDFYSEIHLYINHLNILEKQLQPGKNLLFLADNAGECFFDLPLVEFFTETGIQTTYVVKGYPVQNDITLKDLEYSGLKDAFPVVVDNGSDAIGLHLPEASEGFRKSFDDADIIIAKGMGHCETIANDSDERLFFLAKAKCRPVAKKLNVPIESYVMKNLGYL